MKSYSARADQLPANAHSTPIPAVQPKLLVVLLESVWPSPPTVRCGLFANSERSNGWPPAESYVPKGCEHKPNYPPSSDIVSTVQRLKLQEQLPGAIDEWQKD